MNQELIAYERSDFMPALSVPQAIQRFNTLVEFVQNVMRDGVDYGKVPGTDKNTLMKAGAEKLTTLFGLTVRFQVVEQAQDWTGEAHGGEPFFYYWYRCQLSRGELLIAEADGSCNSRESKYRWREAKRKCPECGTAAINKSKFPPRGAPQGTPPGWYCFSKQGGCGVEFAADDPEITSQSTGRAPNPDICDLVNTIQKMSQKRALVAATLIGCNASEFFTQDLDEVSLVGDGATYAPPVSVVSTTTGEIIDQSPTRPVITKDAPLPPITAAERAATNGERPLVKRLREIVADCRRVGVSVPTLPKPKEMTDEALFEAIDELEFAYKTARKAAEQARDEPAEEPAGPYDVAAAEPDWHKSKD